MKKTAFLCWIQIVLVLSFAGFFGFTATAQNYYPADIGNTWVLESTDATARSTYTLENTEISGGEDYILLQIRTEELSTGDLDTDRYFLSVGSEAIKLHRIILEHSIAILSADFPTPATFFPLQLGPGDKWQIAADAEAKLEIGPTILGKSITDLEVVAFEDVETPAGTFQNCAKIRLALAFTTPFLNIQSITYQWLAPDIGPVQYQNSDELVFSLIDSNLLPSPEEPDTSDESPVPGLQTEENIIPEPQPEEQVTPEPEPEATPTPEPVPYDVTGDRVVNILDLTFVASRFGETGSDADVTGDGTVNILDLVLISQNLSN